MENIINHNKDDLLESAYNEALLQNEFRKSRWKQFKEEQQDVSSRLLSLRENLKHDIMVPIGKFALMKGKLVHTNEVLVSLGGGWFAKKSCAEAVEYCKRRIKECDDMLKKLDKERELLTSRKEFPMGNDLFSGEEIIEPYDEEIEKEWRNKHRESMKAFKKEEAKKRNENEIRDEKDLFELLDALELHEEEDEMNRSELDDIEEETDENSESESDEDEIIDYCKENEKNSQDYYRQEDNNECLVKSNNNGDINQNNYVNIPEKSNNNCAKRTNLKCSQKVSFASEESDDSDEVTEPSVINFKHFEPIMSSVSDNGVEISDEGGTNINCPSDIYKIFTSSNVPKSILKKTNHKIYNLAPNEGRFSGKNHEDTKQFEETDLQRIRTNRSKADSQVIIKEVNERTGVISEAQLSSKKPISRFKAARRVASQNNQL